MTAERDPAEFETLSIKEERAMWAARLAAQMPEERLKTARENLLYIPAYGYDAQTGESLGDGDRRA